MPSFKYAQLHIGSSHTFPSPHTHRKFLLYYATAEGRPGRPGRPGTPGRDGLRGSPVSLCIVSISLAFFLNFKTKKNICKEALP